MAEIFTPTIKETQVGAKAPTLIGKFVPGIEKIASEKTPDGFGIKKIWGLSGGVVSNREEWELVEEVLRIAGEKHLRDKFSSRDSSVIGLPLSIGNGGTGKTTPQTALDILTQVASAANEDIMTKDTLTGKALWKVFPNHTHHGADEEKTRIDSGGVSDYIGAASNDGLLRTGSGLSYIDGGDYVTLDAPGNVSRVKAYLNANQSIPTGAGTQIQFNTETYDVGSEYDNVTNYRFTPTTAGYYHIMLQVRFAITSDPDHNLIAYIQKNGTSVSRSCDHSGSGTIEPSFTTSTDIYLNGTTDYIEFACYQDTGAAKNLRGSSSSQYQYSYFTIHRFA